MSFFRDRPGRHVHGPDGLHGSLLLGRRGEAALEELLKLPKTERLRMEARLGYYDRSCVFLWGGFGVRQSDREKMRRWSLSVHLHSLQLSGVSQVILLVILSL